MRGVPAVILVVGVISIVEIIATKLDYSGKGLTKEQFFDRNGNITRELEEASELILRGNKFDSFVDCSANLTKLQILDLSQNHLQRFYFLCKDEDNLYKLNVSHNQLEHLNDTALTNRITNLQVLDLSHNIIKVITPETFQHMKSLHMLFLGGNPIGNGIRNGSFENLNVLAQLDLANASIWEFPSEVFKPLVRLRHLNLASNPITEIPTLPNSLQYLDVSGTHLLHLGNLDLPHLRILKLNELPFLRRLNINDLAKTRNLTVLSAEHCPQLYQIYVRSSDVDLVPELNRFSIKNSAVTTLDDNLQPIMKRLVFIDLQYNPWNCDCRMRWVLSLKVSKFLTTDVRCKMPNELQGQRLFDLSADDFNCSSDYDAITFYIWLSIPFLIMTAMAVLGLLYTDEYRARCRGRILRPDTVTYKNMVASSGDGDQILED